MRIERLVQWTRDPDHDFLRELEIFNRSFVGPDLFMYWSPRPIYGDRLAPRRVTDQDPRWEFWFTLQESSGRWALDASLVGGSSSVVVLGFLRVEAS